jgi:hypothetical protein
MAEGPGSTGGMKQRSAAQQVPCPVSVPCGGGRVRPCAPCPGTCPSPSHAPCPAPCPCRCHAMASQQSGSLALGLMERGEEPALHSQWLGHVQGKCAHSQS